VRLKFYSNENFHLGAVEQLRSLGYDVLTSLEAGRANQRIPTMKIVELSPRENYRLFLRYEDGTEGVVDLSSMAGRGGFAAWLVPGVFEQAKLSEFGVPEWPGELDLCSDSLYMQLTGKSAEEIFPNLRKRPAYA
jgi:hypothetical protein